jgi:hypothetical protein
MEENEMIRFLNSWFDNARPTEVGMPFRYQAYTKRLHCRFFIYYSEEPNLSGDLINGLMKSLLQQAGQDEDMQSPLVMITPQDSTYQISLLAYWEYNKCHLNTKRSVRPINPDTILWIEAQIGARRMHVNSLPLEWNGVIKTISLNTKDIVDSRVLYWRKFTDTYKMMPGQPQDDSDRFNRMLLGTPENEYPNDILDKIILQQIQSVYPEAAVKSKLLLFDTDLLNLRQLKDKLCEYQDLSYCLYNGNTLYPIKYSSFKIECYYYPNFFRPSQVKILSQYNTANVQTYNNIELLRATTYKPISYFNI